MAVLSGTGIAAAIAAGLIVPPTTGSIIGNSSNPRVYNTRQSTENKVLTNEYLDSFNYSDLLREVYKRGAITSQEFKDASGYFAKLDKQAVGKSGMGVEIFGFPLFGWVDGTTSRQKNAIIHVFDEIGKFSDDFAYRIKNLTYKSPKEIGDAIRSGAPSIAGARKPEHFDESFNPEELPEDPVHLWTNPELAVLYDMNYDKEHYYDQIKAATGAQVDLDRYENEQALTALNSGDTRLQASYLDSIRNNRSAAIAKGATSGAQAAADVLTNLENIQNYSANQAAFAQNAWNNVGQDLLTDAQANLTARSYFDQLANNLMDKSAKYYASDNARLRAQLEANGSIWNAEANKVAGIMNANANMDANYVQANAAVNAVRAGVQAQANEYAWLFENALEAYNGDVAKALNVTDRNIWSAYFNKQNPINVISTFR